MLASMGGDRKSTRLNSSHVKNSYAVFCLKKKIGAVVIVLAVIAVARRVDVRLALIVAGLSLLMLTYQTQADIHTLSLHDALPISSRKNPACMRKIRPPMESNHRE